MNTFTRIKDPTPGDFVVIDVDGAADTSEKRGTKLPIHKVDFYNVYTKPSNEEFPYSWVFSKKKSDTYHFESLFEAPTIKVERLTLPIDSKERKNFPVYSGCLRYFPAALAGVAKTSKLGNDKHNPGEELHHARGKSMDHTDCIIRHLMDAEDLLAALNRGDNDVKVEDVLTEVSAIAWRALAYSQEIHERFGAPLAPGARK